MFAAGSPTAGAVFDLLPQWERGTYQKALEVPSVKVARAAAGAVWKAAIAARAFSRPVQRAGGDAWTEIDGPNPAEMPKSWAVWRRCGPAAPYLCAVALRDLPGFPHCGHSRAALSKDSA